MDTNIVISRIDLPVTKFPSIKSNASRVTLVACTCGRYCGSKAKHSRGHASVIPVANSNRYSHLAYDRKLTTLSLTFVSFMERWCSGLNCVVDGQVGSGFYTGFFPRGGIQSMVILSLRA